MVACAMGSTRLDRQVTWGRFVGMKMGSPHYVASKRERIWHDSRRESHRKKVLGCLQYLKLLLMILFLHWFTHCVIEMQILWKHCSFCFNNDLHDTMHMLWYASLGPWWNSNIPSIVQPFAQHPPKIKTSELCYVQLYLPEASNCEFWRWNMQGSLGITQDGAFLKEVPSIAACHGLSVSLCRWCYSFGDARLVNHKQYLAGGGYLKSLGTSKWDDAFHGPFIYFVWRGKGVSASWGSEAACVVRKERFCQGGEKDHAKARCLGCTQSWSLHSMQRRGMTQGRDFRSNCLRDRSR